MEPVSAEARRLAHRDSDGDRSLPSTEDQVQAEAGREDRPATRAVRVLAYRGLRRLANRVEAAGLARAVTRRATTALLEPTCIHCLGPLRPRRQPPTRTRWSDY
jgi:hypothetical protein